ncbi:MAG TPA: CoA transferase [Candidatus Binataceae bacterium]|nr:CoA transferase [Candidatus Binataceae bacterium]
MASQSPSARLSDGAAGRPLAAIRVVEYGRGISAAFAAKLFADVGAEVIKIEPPGGDVTRRCGPFFDDVADPEHAGLFLYLNANKLGAVLDLEHRADWEVFGALLGGADILIHNVPPVERACYGLSSPELCRRFPNLIVTTISPFGDWGPRANYRGYDLNVMHSSGFAAINPACSPYPDLPPTKLLSQQAEFQGGVHAAAASIAAWLHRRRGAAGQAIDVSEQECIAAMLGSSAVFWTHANKSTSRLGVRPLQPWMAAQCADGKLYMACVEEHQWRGLLKLLGNPEWGKEEIFNDRVSRAKNFDVLRPLLEGITRQRKVWELYHEGQRLRLPVAPLNRMTDVYANEQLLARKYFVELPGAGADERAIIGPGAPYQFSTMCWGLRRRAPRLGEHNAEIASLAAQLRDAGRGNEGPSAGPDPSARPLTGLRVLDFSWVWGGPFCTLQLAQLGADVIRVESANRLCLFRKLLPFADNIAGPNRSGLFNQVNQGKRSVVLELNNPAAVEVARRMVRWADVVVENFAPGVLERLGLGYGELRRLRPDLIMLSISGYGQSGPYRNYVSYGGITGAHSGFYAHNGPSEDEPRDLGATYADPAAGIMGATAILLALANKAMTGEGQYIDLAMMEALGTLAAEGLLEVAMNGREPRRLGNHDRWMSPHQCYKARGDAEMWVSIAVGSEDEWRSLCTAMDQPELADDPRFATAALRKTNESELERIIERWTKERDRWEITETLQRAGVAAFPTLSNKDLFEDPHMMERGFVIEIDHPEIGPRKHTSQPWTMSGTSNRKLPRAPLLGEHTVEVLQSVFAYSDEEIEMLKAQGALGIY